MIEFKILEINTQNRLDVEILPYSMYINNLKEV